MLHCCRLLPPRLNGSYSTSVEVSPPLLQTLSASPPVRIPKYERKPNLTVGAMPHRSQTPSNKEILPTPCIARGTLRTEQSYGKTHMGTAFSVFGTQTQAVPRPSTELLPDVRVHTEPTPLTYISIVICCRNGRSLSCDGFGCVVCGIGLVLLSEGEKTNPYEEIGIIYLIVVL